MGSDEDPTLKNHAAARHPQAWTAIGKVWFFEVAEKKLNESTPPCPRTKSHHDDKGRNAQHSLRGLGSGRGLIRDHEAGPTGYYKIPQGWGSPWVGVERNVNVPLFFKRAQ